MTKLQKRVQYPLWLDLQQELDLIFLVFDTVSEPYLKMKRLAHLWYIPQLQKDPDRKKNSLFFILHQSAACVHPDYQTKMSAKSFFP